MHRTLLALALCTLAAAAATAYAGSATGTYVGGAPQAAYLLDIVQAGNQLTGRYEQYDQRSDHGEGIDETFTFTAVIDGTHFAGQIKSSLPLSSPIPVSGEVDGSNILLNGDAQFHLALKRDDQRAFQTQVATLHANASIVDQLGTVHELMKRMTSFDMDSKRDTARFPAIEGKVVALTEQMRGELVRERAILGSGEFAVRRAQVSEDIHALNGDARQAARTVRMSGDDLTLRVQQLRLDISRAEATCAPVLERDTSTPLHEGCRRLEFEASRFKEDFAETKEAFRHFDAVWQRELKAQMELEQASDVASR